jgi:predicted PhzF superfamily epimerase YddE/YHI9
MASAYVIFRYHDPSMQSVTFDTRSGPLSVRRDGERLAMTLPRRAPEPCEAPAALIAALGRAPELVMRSRDYLVVYPSEADVRALKPDLVAIAGLDAVGVIVTAPGTRSDFVSRFFAPKAGVPEDPATGSSHCTLVPYWAKRLEKTRLHALQISQRGGELFCEDTGDSVVITGSAVPYLEGTIEVSAAK